MPNHNSFPSSNGPESSIDDQFNDIIGANYESDETPVNAAELPTGDAALDAARERNAETVAETPQENVDQAVARFANARAEGGRIVETVGDRAGEIYQDTKDALKKGGRALGRAMLEGGIVAVGAASLGAKELSSRSKNAWASAKQRLKNYKEARHKAKIDKAHGEAIAEDQRRTEALQDQWLDTEYDTTYDATEARLSSIETGDADAFNSNEGLVSENQIDAANDARQDIIDNAHSEALAMNVEWNIAKAAEKKAHDAMIRQRARNVAKIQRRNARKEKIESGKDWLKNTRTAKFGRSLKAYMKGVHAAGMENVRAQQQATAETRASVIETTNTVE